MKQLLSLLLLPVSLYAQSTHTVPVIKAGTEKAFIMVGQGAPQAWTIDPATQPDVFFTPRLTHTATVHFATDTDTIAVTLGPGEQTDFIVLLREKDSCRTRIQSPAQKNFSGQLPELHDTIPMVLNEHNTIYVPAVLNGKDSLRLNFDTGSSDLTLTNDVLNGKLGASLKLYNTAYDLRIGKKHYRTAVFPARLAGSGTEGRFGWNLFDGYIVELDYDRGAMIVHSKMPAWMLADHAFTKLDIRYEANIFLVRSGIAQAGVAAEGWFLFDTGYDRTVMLDKDLLAESGFPSDKMKVISKKIMHGAQGNEVPVITAGLDLLQLGTHELKQVPAQVQSANKPLQDFNIHILGNEVLKRFHIFLDFQHNVVYLKPGTHFNDRYIEQANSRTGG